MGHLVRNLEGKPFFCITHHQKASIIKETLNSQADKMTWLVVVSQPLSLALPELA